MLDRLGIRGKLLTQGLVIVTVALSLVVAVVSAALWAHGWRQAKERLTRATLVVSRSLTARICETEQSALRIAGDKDLTSKTSFVLEESGKADIREMIVVERRNLTLALGRAMVTARAGLAAIYSMDDDLVCAAVEVPGKGLRLWCPDDRHPGQFLSTVISSGQAPQPDDWQRAELPADLASPLAGDPGGHGRSGCIVQDDDLWITSAVPVIGMRLNPDTFDVEPEQHAHLVLRTALGAAFVQEQSDLTGAKINLYVHGRLLSGDLPDYPAPEISTTGWDEDGVREEVLKYVPASVKGESYFAAVAPICAGGNSVGSVSIMLPQTETRRSLMWILGLTVAVGFVAAVTATALGIYLSRGIVRPIQTLLERATDIADHHNLDQVIDIKGDDEVGRLAAAFNQMLESLRAYYLDLQSTNAKLEDQIAQRRLAENTYRKLYECTADAVMLLRPDGFIDCNAATLRLFRCEMQEQFLRCHPSDVSPTHQADGRDSHIASAEHIERAMRYGSARFEWVHKRMDGSLFEADVWLTAIDLNGDRVLQAVVRDISEAKRAKENLERLVEQRTADLQAANQSLQREIVERRRAEDKAEAANQAKSQFLANMSHEIRTPMTAILGFAELLTSADMNASERLNHVETIRRNGQHLLAIINDILDLSKIEAGRMVVEKTHCSIVQILQEVASLVQPRAISKKVEFQVEFATAMPERIESDPIRIRQILINLAGNAIKFTERGSVRIIARLTDGPFLRFDVVDTGIGIAAEHLERIFQPFAQAESSTSRRFGGTGLGLTISVRLAEMLGGQITVTSKPGQGSTFTLTVATGSLEGVAMIDDPAGAMAITQEATAPAEGASDGLNCRILLAEDGLDNQRLFGHVLTKAGARVTIVENGSLAVQAALAAYDEGEPFDVILMDMQMPVMDGYHAVRLLRTRGYPGVIIALTAHAMATDREKCLAAGCDGYATKPINRRELMETIQHYLKGSRSAEESQAAKAQAAEPQAMELQAKAPLISELADDPDLGDLVVEFVGQLPKRVEAMRQALEQQDLESLTRLAHQMKGSAGGYGFPRITEAAASLERCTKAHEDLEKLRSSLDEVVDLCGRARASAAGASPRPAES